MKRTFAIVPPLGLVPVLMSAAALALVVAHLVLVGREPQADEGAEAHLWQLLMAGQLPLVALFAVTWLPRDPKRAVWILALQAMAAFAALAPIRILRW